MSQKKEMELYGFTTGRKGVTAMSTKSTKQTCAYEIVGHTGAVFCSNEDRQGIKCNHAKCPLSADDKKEYIKLKHEVKK